MFWYRCRMANYGENFRGPRGPQMCPLFLNHLDNQPQWFSCQKVIEKLKIDIDYSNILKKNIPAELFQLFGRNRSSERIVPRQAHTTMSLLEANCTIYPWVLLIVILLLSGLLIKYIYMVSTHPPPLVPILKFWYC